MEAWKKKAETEQYLLAVRHKKSIWDEYKLNYEEKQLKDNIAYSLYAKPEASYSKKQTEEIDDIYKKCLKYGQVNFSKKIYLKFIFVSVWSVKYKADDMYPLIRVRKDTKVSEDVTNSYFIDHYGRVYSNWDCYILENPWSGFHICFPTRGIYKYEEIKSDKFTNLHFLDLQTVNIKAILDLDFKRANVEPILKTVDEACPYIDAVCAGVTGVGFVLVCFCPPLAPAGVGLIATSRVTGLVSATYAGSRSAARLLDRGRHDQSVDPFTNREARGEWISSAAATLGATSYGAAKLTNKLKAADLGRKFTSTTKIVTGSLNASSLSSDGVEIINAIYEMVEKNKDKEEIPTEDIVQLSADALFFTLTVLEATIARKMYVKARERVRNERRSWYSGWIGGNSQPEGRSTRPTATTTRFSQEIIHITSEEDVIRCFGEL
ncbi:hypothetical protein CHUAL_008983 [Chamberlinius hualienensis]